MELTATKYKQTEVGLIPEDWDLPEIESFSVITTGSSDTQDKIEDGIYQFYVRSNTVERINKHSFDGEAVLTSGDGVGVGKIFHYANGKFDFHQRVYCIYNFKNVDGKYFYLQFSTRFFDRVMSMTAKSSVDSVRMEMIANMKIPLPPTLNEQKVIAQVLSDTDALIQALEKKITKKKHIKKGVMQKLLTPKENWIESKVASVGQPYGGMSGKTKADFSNGNAHYVPFMNVMSNPITDTGYLDSVNINKGESQNKIIKGDLLFNGSSETPEEVGFCSAVLEQIDNLYLNSFCFGFRIFNTKQYDSLFLAYFFRSTLGRNFFYSLAQGATRYNLSKTNFLKSILTLPIYEDQVQIATLIRDIDSEIEQLVQKLTKYHLAKQGMMQQLLTGKIRLV